MVLYDSRLDEDKEISRIFDFGHENKFSISRVGIELISPSQ